MRLRACARLSYAGLLAIALFAAQSNALLRDGDAADIEARRGAFLSTSGSFTLSSSVSKAAATPRK